MSEQIRETLNKLETLINEKGYRKIESKIKLHEFDGKKYLLIDDVIDLCHDVQDKYQKGTERGYLNLSAEERKIGGLGIFMVKKSMDEMLYEYRDGQNMLTLRKRIR